MYPGYDDGFLSILFWYFFVFLFLFCFFFATEFPPLIIPSHVRLIHPARVHLTVSGRHLVCTGIFLILTVKKGLFWNGQARVASMSGKS